MDWRPLFRKKTFEHLSSEASESGRESISGLKRVLGVSDLTLFGVAAVIGAGVFSTIGNAAYHGGPAIVFLFLFTAIACGFCALCYADFASRVPTSGSAYTYSYIAFGEIIAWIIGWDLLMEYAIGDIAITISWSQYFAGLMHFYGWDIPAHFSLDYMTASKGYQLVSSLLNQGISLADVAQHGVDPLSLRGYEAWLSAPRIGSLAVVCDLPALLITALITWVIFLGMEDSRRFSRFMVFLKMAVIFFVIVVGIFYVNPQNWVPFAPHGSAGVLKGVSAIFFAYIGFDVISTMAEECREPQRDLPRAMIYSLFICTGIYVILSLVLTGVVHHSKLQVGDPLAFLFSADGANLPWFSGVIATSAVVALGGVLLVYQLGQTRIWMVMGRDGLLPPFFSRIHPKYRTPWISTLISGFLVAIPSLFLNLSEVTDLNSIGTLFAFMLVSAGVLLIDPKEKNSQQKFRMPYVNAKYLYPALMLALLIVTGYLQSRGYVQVLSWGDFSNFQVLLSKIPLFVFIFMVLVLCLLSYKKSLSFIPVMALTMSSYLTTELGLKTWIRFGVWLVIGACLYFTYGYKHSRLRHDKIIP
ncbi:MAG: amino acid permease [Oligoflexales bacterium]|nr:amino acid permease [Oligoflexales bacterium]